MSLSYSAPLYLFFDVVVPPFHDDEEEFEFAAAGSKNVNEEKEDAPRACASDLSALADELFRGAGVLLPLKLPPRLQHPTDYFSSSAATSPTAARLLGRAPSSSSSSWSPFASSRRQHTGFDPFAAALEKVRRDDTGGPGREPAAPNRRRRARSLSPVRGADDARPAATCLSCSRSRHAGASAAAAKKAVGKTRRRRDGGVTYRRRPSLLVCFGF
ncbi:hypothetical protein BRADI_2g10906v3 [Brachypodium distachyon]|uniref:Uncharacterized protein n=2 Tax=Brachypodium distachyon TaxID=15368 RepID=A0A0Q3FWY3_BRADI|nr:hypothetical protein BRADI_2g10906v3 [Brachypodium distachyon]